MSQTLDLNQLQRSAYREAQQDGLADALLGVTLLVYAAFVAFRGPLTAICVLAALLAGPRLLAAVRKRLTNPRIGRVQFHPEKTRRVLPAVLAYIFLVAAALAIAFAVFGNLRTPSLWWRWLPLFVGMMLVGALTHAHSKSGSARYPVFALIAAAAGLLTSLLNFPSPESRLMTYLLAMGLFLILAGAVLLARFLRSHPTPPQEAPNDAL